MAVTKEDLLISIQADVSSATKGISAVEKQLDGLAAAMKQTSSGTTKAAQSVSGFGAAMVKMQAGISVAKEAMVALKAGFDATVGAFRDKEDAATKLKIALAGLGEKDIPGVTEAFKDFADELQNIAGVDDDVVLGLAAIGKQMGLTDQQTKDLIKTSADVSAAFGKDMPEVFQSLTSSLKGSAEGVAKFIPGLAGMDAGALRAGKGIEELGKRFDGFAALNLETFGGVAKAVGAEFGDIMADIGQAISEGFNLDSGKDFLDLLKRLKVEFKDSLYPAIKAISAAVRDMLDVLGGSLTVIAEAFVVLDTKIKSATISILKMVDDVKGTAATVKGFFSSIFGDADEEAAKVAKIHDELAAHQAALDKQAQAQTARANAAALRGVAAIDKVSQAWNGQIERVKKTSTAIEDLAKKNEGVKTPKFATPDQIAAIQALTDKLNALKAAGEAIGKGETVQINLGAKKELEDLKKVEDQLRKSGALAGQMDQLQAARDQIESNRKAGLAQLDIKLIQDSTSKQIDAAAKLRQDGMTQFDIINDQLMVESQKLDLMEQQAAARGEDITLLKQLNDIQRSMNSEQAKKDQKKAPDKAFEQQQIAGQQAAKGISDAAGGLLGFGSYVQAIIGAVQAIVDIIPQIINGISKVIESIAELPTHILEAVKGLFSSITKFISDFIPGIIDMVQGIIEGLITFITKLPETLGNMVAKLPQMMLSFIDRLPDMIDGLVTSLVDKAPEMGIAIVSGLIQAMPKLVVAGTKAIIKIIPLIVKGMIEGVVKAASLLGDMFKGKFPKLEVDASSISSATAVLKSKLTGATNQLFNVSDLTDAASGVGDAAAAQAKAIGDVIQKAVDALLAAWRWIYDHIIKPFIEALQAVWHFVYETVVRSLQFFADTLGAIWHFVVDTVIIGFKLLWAQLQAIWDFTKAMLEASWKVLKGVWDIALGIFQASTQILKGVWDFAVATFNAAVQILKGVWDVAVALFRAETQLLQGVFAAAVELLKGAWAGIQAIWGGMMGVLSAAFDGVKAIWGGMVGILQALWDGVKGLWDIMMALFSGKISLLDALRQSFDVVFSTFTKAFDAIKTSLEGVFNAFTKAFDATKTALEGVFNAAVNSLGKAFDKLKEAGTAAAKSLSDGIDKLKDAGTAAAKSLTDGFEKLKTAGTEAAKTLSDAGKKAWDNFKDAFDKGKTAFTDLGTSLWTSFKAALDKGKSAVTDLGGAIWDSLKKGLGGLGSVAQNALNALNPANLAAKMFAIDYQGKGTVENALGIDVPFANFAKGGAVPGMAMAGGDSLINDRILALLSPGEAIIPRSKMDDPRIRSIIAAIIDGRFNPPKYGYGAKKLYKDVTGDDPPDNPLPPAPSISDIVGAGKAAGGALAKLYQDSGVADALGNLDPAKAWDKAREQAMQVVMRAFGRNHFGDGGLVGGSGYGDVIPAMLSPGEFVLKPAAARALGGGVLSQLNEGRSAQGPTTQTFNIEIKIDGSKDKIDEQFVRQRLMPTIREELRRASLDNQRVVYSGGIR